MKYPTMPMTNDDAMYSLQLSSSDAVELVSLISRNRSKSVNPVAVLITSILLIDAPGSTARLEAIFDAMDFNSNLSLSYTETIVMCISVGSAMAGILEVKTCCSQERTVEVVERLFRSIGRSQTEFITREEFVCIAEREYLINPCSFDNYFKSFFSNGKFIKDYDIPQPVAITKRLSMGMIQSVSALKTYEDVRLSIPKIDGNTKLPFTVNLEEYNGGRKGFFVRKIDAGKLLLIYI